MTVKEIMERAGITQTGRAVAYIKDALEELNYISETHVRTVRMDINRDQRFYEMPKEFVKILDVRCKHHDNTDNTYRSVPRAIYEPPTEDADGS